MTSNDHQQAFYANETVGNYTSVYFQPYWPSGGIQYETKTSGRTAESSSSFSGTCADASVIPAAGQANGYMKTHTGNISIVVTQFP